MTTVRQERRDEREAFNDPALTRQQRLDAARRLGLNVTRTRRPNRRPILPMWAGAALQMFDALHEQTAATDRQRAAQ